MCARFGRYSPFAGNVGGCGGICEPGRREALARAIDSLIEDSDRRQECQNRAFTQALEFTPDRMASAYREAYEQLTQS
nr:hypothetical protein [Phormidium sp. CCY1219]